MLQFFTAYFLFLPINYSIIKQKYANFYWFYKSCFDKKLIQNLWNGKIFKDKKFKKYLKQINKKMDSLIGIKGKDFIILAADTFNAYSVLKMKV